MTKTARDFLDGDTVWRIEFALRKYGLWGTMSSAQQTIFCLHLAGWTQQRIASAIGTGQRRVCREVEYLVGLCQRHGKDKYLGFDLGQ